ncbi:MerR family transcriptional regulator [Microbulbifer flavimaris]|uniref:MerR family transcriptional regulator n=1 Tax=Microbulbifer flavimaris TaxID=1781068 RepID=A0ABX4I0U7_9GAMM|nr:MULTISPECIES: chaperone modulator CbpM [Microbulbifer]KUJ83009.1 MerR family transcriptional regulator [Microbulbifer sp. ZGT114]PCO05194.1 MerR family transcriptional regulator [Microbulbifer flavimaris]
MVQKKVTALSGTLLDEQCLLTLSELCRACELPAEEVMALVEEGVIEPASGKPTQWRFSAVSIRRVQRVRSLKRDLGVNMAGAALAVELLEEIERLRARLKRLERER